MERIESIAFKESLKAVDTKQQFGCLITRNKRVVSTGHNFRAFERVTSCCCHAEMNTIYKHMKQMNKWKLYYQLLKIGYRFTGVFSRCPGKVCF
jgi:tRNA(Arg) A34 adenosine deaminase TadA